MITETEHDSNHNKQDKQVDFGHYPHLDMRGKQLVKEILFQVNENREHWTASERTAWIYLLNDFLATAVSYEEAIELAEKRGYERGLSDNYNTIFDESDDYQDSEDS